MLHLSACPEEYLEVFPLAESELECLLKYHVHYNEGMSFSELLMAAVLARDSTVDFKYLKLLQDMEEVLTTSDLIPAALSSTFPTKEGPVWAFLEAVVTLLGRRGSPRTLHSILFELCRRKHAPEDDVSLQKGGSSGSVTAEHLVDLCHGLVDAFQYLQGLPPLVQTNHSKAAWIKALNRKSTEQGISLAAFHDWATWTLPELHQTLATFCSLALLPTTESHRKLQFTLPTVSQSQHALSLAALSPVFSGKRYWHSLYSSDEDAFSFVAVLQALQQYPGPTVMILETTQHHDVFGYYTESPWTVQNNWHGSEGDSFLFSLRPHVQVYSRTYEKEFCMHLTTHANKRELAGLAIGGISGDTPRLHIPPSLENCKTSSVDATYESGELLSSSECYFNVEQWHIYALADSHEEFLSIASKGIEQMALQESARQKAAQVDKRQFLQDFATGAIINNLYTHREQSRGRHSFVADGEGKGYHLEPHDSDNEDQNKEGRRTPTVAPEVTHL